MTRTGRCFTRAGAAALAALVALGATLAMADPSVDLIDKPYNLDTGMTSRSISFENPTGEPGQGGKAASNLGPGRKGSPSRTIKPGETVDLCNIQGPGCIRHVWMTTAREPDALRSLVIRGWWEGQEHPSIECPVGDFFGFAHGKVMPYQSAVHSVGAAAGMNLWLPMPFDKRAKFTFTNEGKKAVPLYYQIDYTVEAPHPEHTGMLHVLFRRENPTTPKQDFELLPLRKNMGRFIGSVMGIRSLDDDWWGEGEVKVYMDGDKELPTICGTGSEDYIGLSWGTQQTPFMYNGCSLDQKDAGGKTFVSMYRWHLPDPIVWLKEARITIQQIAYNKGLQETQDDWSCATFWYEPLPSAALPKMPDVAARTADLWKEPEKK
ncbi:MAG: DUF2961 domain-containing protein [Planctomycetia bacterium]|nr:DUF2961 domain-containing protein [Planctomycetia bacterium]